MDFTSPSLDKLPIFAQLGVAEVWRYAGGRMGMFGLQDEVLRYELLARFVEEGLRTERPARVRGVRQWVRSRARRPETGDAW